MDWPKFIKPYEPRYAKGVDYDIAIDSILRDNGTMEADEYEIPPHEVVIFLSKEVVEIPEGYVGFLAIRKSYLKKGLRFEAGFVHSGYKGRLEIELENRTDKPIKLKRGERPVCLRILRIP